MTRTAEDHKFLKDENVEPDDLRAVLDLAAIGWLAWGYTDRSFSTINSNVAASQSEEVVGERNLREVEVRGQGTRFPSFRSLKLTDAEGIAYTVDPSSQEPTLSLARRVLFVANIGVRAPRRRLGGRMQECEDCGRETGHIGLHDAPHGIVGATMKGSARIECTCCGKAEPLDL